MKIIVWIIFCFSCVSVSAQISCKSLVPNSSIIWKQDRFFIHEYIINNQNQHSVTLNISDSFDYYSDISVKYSVENQFQENKLKLIPGVNVFKVWVRYNQKIAQKAINFEIKNDSFSFVDTIQTYGIVPEKPFIHSQLTTQYLDYFSPSKENTELQLFDELWNLVAVHDAKMKRFDLSKLGPKNYYLKVNQSLFMIKLVDPLEFTPLPSGTYSTIDRTPNLRADRPK